MVLRATTLTLLVFCVEAWNQHASYRGRAFSRSGTVSGASSSSDICSYDVAIIGSGPAACSLASLLTAGAGPNPPKVALLSKNADAQWVPNYGCWTEEWAALSALYKGRGVPGIMEKGVGASWPDTDCFFGEDSEEKVQSNPEGSFRRTLGREYLRISRAGLKEVFYGSDETRKYDVIKEDVLGAAIGTNIYSPAGSVVCHPTFTELRTVDSGLTVRAKVVVDATGSESPFTIRDDRGKEGYQIAYGVECFVSGPGVTETKVGDYDRTKMTLFDYRSEAWRGDNEENVVAVPTFNYVMPLKDGSVFFEETSLVARPAVSFQECKARLEARLGAMGVTIGEVLEEEYCYIPMGGSVPRKGQRLVPVGGAAGLVHPATGYQIARALVSNVDVCEQILEELKAGVPAGEQEEQEEEEEEEEAGAGGEGRVFDPDAAAARILGRTWTPKALRQRNFAVFGGDFLMDQNVEGLKGFFSGFFKLEKGMWGGFLAGWKGLPGNEYHDDWLPRIVFGVTFVTKLPLKVAAAMALAIVKYALGGGLELVQSVTPLLGEPEAFEAATQFRSCTKGDVAAKEEARAMMKNK
mmetsp:Transcript_66190/g.129735  ORF Transcript_66190/g.129735 Transcript_66190/m.129735 type:complete len:580 (+) Transcript_66190:95-1834(+)